MAKDDANNTPVRYYLDTEFNGFGGELISLALVREDGDALYLLYPEPLVYEEWVALNVVPIIERIPHRYDFHRVNQNEGARLIANFFAARNGVPHIVTDWPDDVRYLCQAIITGPGMMAAIPRLQFDVVRVDAYPTALVGAVQHNALWDALALRECLSCRTGLGPKSLGDGPYQRTTRGEVELENRLAIVIDESLGADWHPSDGARDVMTFLKSTGVLSSRRPADANFPPAGDGVDEAAIEAAFRAINGPDLNPFAAPESWEFAREVAEAVIARARTAVGEDFLAQLRRVNTERYQAWVGDGQDAGILFDAAELGGEVGELLNVIKKLEREDRGWRGSRAAPEDFADECADVLICLDKLARRKGVDLAAATVAKFNATSVKVELPHRLVLQPPIGSAEG